MAYGFRPYSSAPYAEGSLPFAVFGTAAVSGLGTVSAQGIRGLSIVDVTLTDAPVNIVTLLDYRAYTVTVSDVLVYQAETEDSVI